MTKRYNLYLDESETYDGDHEDRVFCIAGIIVEEECANSTLVQELNDLKKSVWGHLPNYESIILHEKDVKDAFNRYNSNSSIKPNYNIFRTKANVITLYRGLERILRNQDIVVLAAVVKVDELSTSYPANIQNDKYLMSLQIIMENFVHFLITNDGVGNIIYEHNGDHNCKNMRMKYNMIKTMGTLYIQPYIMQEKLINIEFPKKTQNLAGLQFADFIPNIIARKISGKDLVYDLYRTIRRVCYDAGIQGSPQGKDKFGIKVLK